MKLRLYILILVLLLALVVGLGREFWPRDNSAPGVTPNTTKTADEPKRRLPTVAAVDLPKKAPAKPGDSPNSAQAATANTQGPGPSPIPPSSPVTSTDSTDTADLGDVYFDIGVPQQITLKDGTSATFTAGLDPNGNVLLRVDLKRPMPNGGVGTVKMMGDAPSGQAMNFPARMSDLKIKITPHIN